MLEGKTKSGFEFNISDETLDDWELFEDISEMDEKGGELKFIKAAKRLLGQEQYESLKEFLRNNEGRVSATLMSETISEIFFSTNEGKN